MSESENKPIPVVLSMLVCDDVVQDQRTGKTTIVGTFSDINARGFPAIHPGLVVYFEITDGRGETNIEIRLVFAETDEAILSMNGPVKFDDPRWIAAINVRIGNIVFPKAGEYRFQLYCYRELLIERRIVVHPPTEPEDSKDA